MRVFVTGASGFIGSAIVEELVSAGHEVTGLVRSKEAGEKLKKSGAKALIGTVEDLDCLRYGASNADAAVHTAFYHKLSHIPLLKRLAILLGGSPTGIFERFMAAAVETDRRAIETICASLSGSNRAFAAAFGTLSLPSGRLCTENDSYDTTSRLSRRAETEDVLKKISASGLRTSVVRLPPIVHGQGDKGFAPMLIQTAKKNKESGFVENGDNRWPSVHRYDAARLFRLALENGPAGGVYHCVAEEGVPFRKIADVIGRKLNVPVTSKTREQASKGFGFLSPLVHIDNPVSSELTKERLGWTPTEKLLLADLEESDYFSNVN